MSEHKCAILTNVKNMGVSVRFHCALRKGEVFSLIIKDVFYVESVLLFVKYIREKGYDVRFKSNNCSIAETGELLKKVAFEKNGLLKLDCAGDKTKAAEMCNQKNDATKWHLIMKQRDPDGNWKA